MLTDAGSLYDKKKALEESTHSHYCWIKNLSALMGSQISKYGMWICGRCLIHFNSHEKLVKHKITSHTMNECAIEMPCTRTNYEVFSNHKNELKIPFIIAFVLS